MAAPPSRDFASFYRSTLLRLRRRLGRVLRSSQDAEDVAHDAYKRVFEAMEKQQIDSPEGFLFTTAHRIALDRLRRRRNAPVRESDDKVIELTASTAPSVQRVVIARQEWAEVEAAIAALPMGCGTVLRLCKFEHLSHAEIAARLGISVSTVEKQHARALRLLRAVLHEDADTDAADDAGEKAGDTAGIAEK